MTNTADAKQEAKSIASEAEHRWFDDAKFHSRVYRAVQVRLAAGPVLPKRAWDEDSLIAGAMIALHLAEHPPSGD